MRLLFAKPLTIQEMKQIDVTLTVLKQAEFTATVPDDVFEKGEDEVRKHISSRIDNELDYADVTEKFKYWDRFKK